MGDACNCLVVCTLFSMFVHHCLAMEKGLVQLSEAMSHAVWDYPRRMGQSGEFWQNVIHWRSDWETTPVHLPWELHELYKQAKYMTLKDEPPRSEGPQYASGEEWRRTIIALKEWSGWAKAKMMLNFGVPVGESKVWCGKEQYCIGTWNVRSMNQGKLEWSNRRWQEWTSTF